MNHTDLPFNEYKLIPGLNQSSIKKGWNGRKVSPLHLQHALTEPETESTVAQKLGVATHVLALQPGELLDAIAVYDGGRRDLRVKKYKDFLEDHAGKVILNPKEMVQVKGMHRALWTDSAAREFLAGPGEREVSLTWEDVDTGIGCKARLDSLPERGALWDVKTTASLTPSFFAKSAWSFLYHMQASFYRHAVKVETGEGRDYYLVIVEQTPPHDVAVAEMPIEAMDMGEAIWRESIMVCKTCGESGEWPGLGSEMITVPLPSWVVAEIQPSFDGI